jgi:hydroxymethylpyrimidine/phosphomethylpyrimidine kinase
MVRVVMGSGKKLVLTIAGSDPTGGAGIQADLRTLFAIGVHGVSVISAITAQDSTGVRGVFPVESAAFSAQLETLLKDGRVDAVKTGMLTTPENVRITADLLRRFPPRILVIDPVISSSNGVVLLQEEACPLVAKELFPLATLVTPNLSEARFFSGRARVQGEEEEAWIQRMCRAIKGLGPQGVLITGGHRQGEPTDLLYHEEEFSRFSSPRVSSILHGSGCVFSSALCGFLALGFPLGDAVSKAKQLVVERFRTVGDLPILP